MKTLKACFRSLSTLALGLAVSACSGDLHDEAQVVGPPPAYEPAVSGVLSVQVKLAPDLPVADASVSIHLAGGSSSGPAIATNEQGLGAAYLSLLPDSELRVWVHQNGLSGTLRARVSHWDGITSVAIDPMSTLRAAWLDANPSSTLDEANVAVRSILGIPARVPDSQLLTATKWFSGKIFIDAAQGNLDSLVAQVVTLAPSQTPRFADPAGQDALLQFSVAPVVSWLVTKAKENAFSGVFGIAQFGVGLYTKDREQEALRAQFAQVNEKLDALQRSISAVSVTSSAGLTALNCSAYSTAVAQFDGVAGHLAEMSRWDNAIETLRVEQLEALPNLIFYPLGPTEVAAMSPEDRAKYDLIAGSRAYRDLTDFRRMKDAAFVKADALAQRVGFPSRLIGDRRTIATGTLDMLDSCIRLDRSYIKAVDQQLLINEIELRRWQAAYLQIARLAVFDKQYAQEILDRRPVVMLERAELIARLEAINGALSAGRPSITLEASAGTDAKPAEAWLPDKNVVLRLAEQAPVHAFDGMIHAAKAAGPGTSFDGGRHYYGYVNFNPANTRDERMLGPEEYVLFQTPSTPRETQRCSGATVSGSCPGTLREWLLSSTGGKVAQDSANLDRFDLFQRSVALAGLGNVYWQPGDFLDTKYNYAYYHVFDLNTWQRKKVVLYNDERSVIRKACLGGWYGWNWSTFKAISFEDMSASRDWQEYPNPRPYTIAPPSGWQSATDLLFRDTRSHACIHSTRDRFASRLATVRPVRSDEHVLWSESKAKAKLGELGLDLL